MDQQDSASEAQFRALVAEIINPNDPRLKAAVVEVLQECLSDVFTRVHTQLNEAGFPEAAEFVRRNFGG